MAGTRWVFFGTCARGTGVALYDYADYAESLLGAKAAVVCKPASTEESYNTTVERLQKRFGDRVTLSTAPTLCDRIVHALRSHNATHLYEMGWAGIHPRLLDPCLGSFSNEGKLTDPPMWEKIRMRVKHAVHAIFDGSTPYGDSFAKLSPAVPGAAAVVPYVVRPLTATTADLRDLLQIPLNATVFCSYGGYDSFNLGFVRDQVIEPSQSTTPRSKALMRVWHHLEAISRRCASDKLSVHRTKCASPNVGAQVCELSRRQTIARRKLRWGLLDYFFPQRRTAFDSSEVYFLFANHKTFCPRNDSGFIVHLANLRQAQKQRFVNTCDAMLHGRARGETFGLAVAEFSMSNKPVFTWARSGERAHIDILGDNAVLYDVGNLTSMLRLYASASRTRRGRRGPSAAYEGFLPPLVMQRFCDVFYRGQHKPPGRCPSPSRNLSENPSDRAPCLRYYVDNKRKKAGLDKWGARLEDRGRLFDGSYRPERYAS